jgi:chitinase
VIPAFSAWVNDPYYMAQPGGSAPAPAPVPAPDAPPSAPASIATSTYQTSITVAWGAASDDVGIAGYRVYLGAAQVAHVDAATTSATITSGVTCGTRYDVSVSAVDSAGNEGARAAKTAYTVKC